MILDDVKLDLLRERADAQDRVGYYGLLAQWGDTYAILAAGVVSGDQFSGRMANAFLAERALLDGVYLIPETAESIGIQLMQLDFLQREKYRGILNSKQIEDYHATVFQDHDASIRAWTAYVPLRIFEENHFILGYQDAAEAREALWAQMVTVSTVDELLGIASALLGVLPLPAFVELQGWIDAVQSIALDEAQYVASGIGSPFPPDGLVGNDTIRSNGLGTALSVDAEGGDDRLFGSHFNDILAEVRVMILLMVAMV